MGPCPCPTTGPRTALSRPSWGLRKRVRKFRQENREKFKRKQLPKKFTNSTVDFLSGPLPGSNASLGWQILILASVHLGNLLPGWSCAVSLTSQGDVFSMQWRQKTISFQRLYPAWLGRSLFSLFHWSFLRRAGASPSPHVVCGSSLQAGFK